MTQEYIEICAPVPTAKICSNDIWHSFPLCLVTQRVYKNGLLMLFKFYLIMQLFKLIFLWLYATEAS